MTSHAPGSCCFAGVKHEGTAAGEIKQTFGDFETYYSYPPDKTSTKHGILLLTDVIGHKFINAQLIADQFAANGYLVLMPDLFYGDPIQLNRPPDFDLMKWLTTGGPREGGHTYKTVDPIVEACIKEMREKLGVEKLGAVGYCFGAKYVVRYLKPGNVDVGYCAHPSFVEKEELEKITGPLAISAAETDPIFPAEKRHESEEILKEVKQPYQINLYSGVVHGFAVRCDLEKKVEKFAKESAFLQAVNWFEEYLK